MRNFFRVAEGVDTAPLLHAIYRQPGLWGTDKVRTTFDQSPHKDVDDILLRFSDSSDPNIGDQLVCENLEAFRLLPQARPLVFGLMARVDGEILGRVMITKLPAGKRIAAHRDVIGRYANMMRRYHIPLQSHPDCVFRADDEWVHMAPGTVWDFNAHAEHEVINDSPIDRIHLIVDIRTSQ